MLDGTDIALSLVGPDRPGIVREISAALSERNVNVVEMDSWVSSAPMAGEALFEASVTACIPQTDDLDDLEDQLDDIANDMTLDIKVERI